MNIGKASEITGLPSKTIRYYEQIGLVEPQRAQNGYRHYNEDNIHCLAFVRHARGLGFNIDECKLLLSLYKDKNRASADVKRLALEKIAQIDRKMSELDSLRQTLQSLADHCHGDSRSECPIIEGIAHGPDE